MSKDLTQLLAEGASPAERDQLFRLVYAELKQLARRELGARSRNQTLSTGPLVHEAYLKLFPDGAGGFESRRHFFGAAARAMRQVVVDQARSKLSARRGQGQAALNLDEVEGGQLGQACRIEDLVRLDRAFDALGEVDERALRVAELRYFVGLELSEIAQALGVSVPTIKRDSHFIRNFLEAALAA